MSRAMHPAPKPPKRVKPTRKAMQRTAMNRINVKRKGSAFPKVRDKEYRRWVWTENECLLAHSLTYGRLSVADVPFLPHAPGTERKFGHRCFGAITPAHVGEHRAQGAPDFGMVVPLCRAAHQFYDEQRPAWLEATGYTERRMALAASGYALKYTESGGQRGSW